MLGMHYPITLFLPGTLAGNHVVTFSAPVDLQLVEVSAVQSSVAGTGAGQVKVGTPSADAAHLANFTIGVNGTPVAKRRADFVGGELPRIRKGESVRITFTNGATASQNVGILLTFTEG
jgi:hypothetical protein